MKYKLAYICGNDSWGGLEMNQLRNASWMKARGHEVVILCLKDSPIEIQANAADIPVITIEKHRKYYDYKRGKQIVKIIQTEKISHLIVRATLDMSIAAFAKSKLKHKLHLSYFMEMQLGVKKKNILHTLRFKYFDLWSCPLNFLAQQVQTMTKFSSKKIKVIPSGLDLSQFALNMDKKSCREQLNLPIDELLFGLIGRFDINKGQLLLLEAMNLCENKNFSIVLLGEPTRNEGDDYFEQMKAVIEKYELKDRVHILPFRKDIEPFYKAMDWFVMASKAETFGMVTIEAMACGTPTLGSNAGGTPEILKFGELGQLFTSMNSTDLAKNIDDIIQNKIHIDSAVLKESAKIYDHHLVCEQVEKAIF